MRYRKIHKVKLAEYEKNRLRNNTDEYKKLRKINGKKLYIKTRKLNKQFINGKLNIDSNLGKATIIEYVVYYVLKDAVSCNNNENFCAEYDLISESLGTINVKSSCLCKVNRKGRNSVWRFKKSAVSKIPDYYICVGLNENRTEILHVWMIPGYDNVVKTYGIGVTNSLKSLSRVEQYEVDVTQYNEVYQNLNIYTLPEFCNLDGVGDNETKNWVC